MAVRANEKIKEELMKQGKKIWSISRINSYHNCAYGYHKTYNEGDRGLGNIYSHMGSVSHDSLERFYNGEIDRNKIIKDLEDGLDDADMLDIKFPNESIGDSWKSDMRHFVNNFTKLPKPLSTEEFALFEIAPDIFVQGYIDAIEETDGAYNIYDWKTSAKFSGDKLTDAGRQLVLYKMALESEGKRVDKVGWMMLKYVNICYMQKNGTLKKTMFSRGKWVKEFSKQTWMIKQFEILGVDEFEYMMLIDKAIEDNNIDGFPESIKSQISFEDAFVEYNVTDEITKETIDYIVKNVEEINSKDKHKESEWKPLEMFKMQGGRKIPDHFFCSVLCSHRKTCPHLKAHFELIESEENKEDTEMRKLFG